MIESHCHTVFQYAAASYLIVLHFVCTTFNMKAPPKIAKSKAFLSRTLSQLSTIDGCFVGEFQHESVFLVGLYLRECDQKATPEVFEPRIACRMDRQDGRTISANTGIENRLVIGCEPSL